MVVNNGFIVMFHDLINTKLDSKPSSEAWIKWQLPTNYCISPISIDSVMFKKEGAKILAL